DAIEVMEMDPTNNNKNISTFQNNHKNDLLLDIELEERKIALLERQTRIRKEATEVRL
ncbi:23697_t:CDS:1, partial [Cetraspora pellucida]